MPNARMSRFLYTGVFVENLTLENQTKIAQDLVDLDPSASQSQT